MRRKVLIGLAGALIVLAVAAVIGWWWMTKPMYTPGDVRAGRRLTAPLDPPPQAAAGVWTVEPGITLRYFASGQGRNLLFVHGGPRLPTQRPYSGFERLNHRVYYYDARGCGRSTRPFDRIDSIDRAERTLGLGAQVADIERIRRILGEAELILAGHSWGGLVAALYAAEFPERIERLVLIAPAAVLVMPTPGADVFELLRARLPEASRAGFEAWRAECLNFRTLFSKSDKDLAALNLGFTKYYAEAVPGAPKPEPAGAGGWMVWAQYMSLGRRHDWRAAMRAVTAPVLVLHGARDLQPEAATRAWADAFPNARFEVLKGAGHFPFIETPDEFARAVAR